MRGGLTHFTQVPAALALNEILIKGPGRKLDFCEARPCGGSCKLKSRKLCVRHHCQMQKCNAAVPGQPSDGIAAHAPSSPSSSINTLPCP